MKITIACTLVVLSSVTSTAQSIVDVAESTLKVAAFGEEIFYYGFAEGDKLIFSFEEVKGKELKEVEITELPSSTKFMDYKTSRINSKAIEITRTGIFRFRFANSAISGRICKFKIQRIPVSTTTQSFNTSVYWETVTDTSYTPVEERYLFKSDTIIENQESTTKVSSQTAISGNRNIAVVDLNLPEGTLAWSYYIGVGKESNEAYQRDKDAFVGKAAKQASTIPGYGALAALAIHGINTFSKVQGRDNVKYWFITDWDNVLLFQQGASFNIYKTGDVISEAARMQEPKRGKVYIGLLNDNVMEPIEVTVRLSAFCLNQDWRTRMVNKMNIQSYQRPYLKQ